MSKAKDIFVGFKNLITGQETPDEERKLKICSTCSFRKKKYCGVCGCYLPAKVKSPGSECPKNKW